MCAVFETDWVLCLALDKCATLILGIYAGQHVVYLFLLLFYFFSLSANNFLELYGD